MKKLVLLPKLLDLRVLWILLVAILSCTAISAQVTIPGTYPPNGNLYPWGYQNKGTSWNTSSYLPFVYNRIPFRIMLPPGVTYNSATNTFSNPSGTKFAANLFLHGLGEVGFENGYQLRNCAKGWMDAMNAGKYKGFLIFPQNFTEFWGADTQEICLAAIENLIDKGLVDPYKVTLNGLSSGGHGVWTSSYFHPMTFAASAPMSAANVGTIEFIPEFIHIPLMESQGGLDKRPTPGTAYALRDAIIAAGGNIKFYYYPELGHGTWDRLMTEPDFFPFFVRANKTNPHVFFGRTEFCAGDPVNVKLGLTAGFEGYQWRKDGLIIDGATSNEITVTEFGTYDARVKRKGVWSYWSPTPVVLKIKAPTVTPPIQLAGGFSTAVIPDPNGNSNVTLTMPAGYVEYIWKKVGSETVVGTQQAYVASSPGQYIASVKELYGCSSNYSSPVDIIDANGAAGPPPAINLGGYALSQTSAQLTWSQNPTPNYNETGFEIWRSTSQGGPYILITKTGADVTSYQNTNLSENTNYYYLIRAVNNAGGSAPTAEVGITTERDSKAPTSPLDLRSDWTMPNSVSLLWDAATDNVGVYRYDVYRDGVKVLVSETNTATLFNLNENQVYRFSIVARDYAGNQSAPSNQLTIAAVPNGLNYKYYEGAWTVLPDFNGINPIKSGHVANIDITPRNRNNSIAFYWEGEIVIPVAGNYTFETRSDAGSKLYIGGYDEAKLLVNNDGLHSSQYREGTYNFPTPGTYPIVITYFKGSSGTNLIQLYWKNTANGIGATRQAIPNSAFVASFTMPGATPTAPSNLTTVAASYKQINLSWTDNSSNENGFQVFRSLSNDGTYYSVGLTNATNFQDTTALPNTRYFYRVQALGQYGVSGFNTGIVRGFDYSYYEADFTTCPPIDAATPKTYGISATFDLTPKQRTTQFAFKWSGSIIIPTTGTYTFYMRADDGSILSINNQTIVTAETTTERSGSVVLNAGVYPVKVLYRQRAGSSSILASWQGPGFSKIAIPASAFRGNDANATTLPLPAVPSAPSVLVATTISTSQINLTFVDNSADEKNFILYRSTGINTGYAAIATLPVHAGTGSIAYSDNNLFTNVRYYYKVVATNVGGESLPTNEANAKTLDNAPEIEEVSNRTMRWDAALDINLFASDPDVESLTISAQNLPSFATLVDYGDGTALMSFAPTQASEIGTYNITVRVDDQNGGFNTKSFTLTLNSNYTPEWSAVPDHTVVESQNLTFQVTATDVDAGLLVLHAYNMPAFGAFIDNGNRTGTFTFNPTYFSQGSYLINLEAVDANGAASNVTIRVIVEDVKVNYKVLVDFNSSTTTNGPTPWNSTALIPAPGLQVSNLLDEKSEATDIDLTFVNAWGPQANGVADLGVVTGNNSGVYPDNVMKSYYYVSDNAVRTLKYSGLSQNFKYSFAFFGSRADVTSRVTQYTIGTTIVSLDAGSNSQNVVRIEGVSPDSNGEISINVNKANTSQFGYLNAMEVIAYFNDGLPPAAPTIVNAVSNLDGSVSLAWTDNSYSESNFSIYRSTSMGGAYSLMKTVSANTTSYKDSQGIQGLVTYYYKVSANNTIGSAESNVYSIAIPNRKPVIANISAQQVAENRFIEVIVTATDPENDVITLSATGLPGFASFTDNGNGTGLFYAAPVAGNHGSYQIQFVATDVHSNVSTPAILTLNVQEVETTQYLVNFNDTRYPIGAPWNSWNATPLINRTLSNIKADDGTSSTITLTLLDAWTAGNIYGEVTGNNTGLFPDDVMRTFYYYNNIGVRRVKVSGLDPAKNYNFKFFASRDGAGDKTTNYTIGSTTVSLNASDNVSQTANINGVKSDVNGELIINVQKTAASQFAYLNALVIEAYEDNGLPLAPSNFVAKALTKNSLEISWSDNSSNETGFEIFRASQSNGPWSLLSTPLANIRNYINTGLAANTKYYYKIRAVNAAGSSAYTSIASAVTLDYAVYINFDDGRNGTAPAPWNTTGKVPIEGDVWTDLKNDLGQSTGINMTLVQSFSGSNPFGVNTGNNSGIYPDLVMQSFYYNEVAVTARLKFSGLAPSYDYNLVYFASRVGTGNRNTDYTVNGNVITLNASGNSTTTAQHTGIRPDANGEIFLEIKAGTGSTYGYLNALILQAYLNPGGASAARLAQESEMAGSALTNTIVTAYPNPVKNNQNIMLQFETKVSQDLDIRMLSATGVEVFKTNTSIDLENNTVELDLSGKNLNGGLYLIRIFSGAESKLVRIIKE